MEEPNSNPEPLFKKAKDKVDEEAPNFSENNANKNVNPSKGKDYYIVTEYNELCEDYSRIERAFPLNYSKRKIFLYVVINLITGFLINLCIVWFPNLKLKLLYKRAPVQSAKYIAVYGTDKKLYIIPLKKITLPNISGSFLETDYESNIPKDSLLIFFTFKLFKYIYVPSKNTFTALKYEIKTSYNRIHQIISSGLSEEETQYQRLLFGVCDLQIEINSFFKILVLEFTDPFYIFQVFSVILWMFNNYQLYASLIIVATLVSLILSSYETRQNLVSIQEMAKYSCNVKIYKKSKTGGYDIRESSSVDLVPGDLFEVQDEGLAMPCDCILVNGTVIVNESMLTGESTPIIKSSIPRIEDAFDLQNEKKKFLFAGTTIIQKRTVKNEKVLCIVYSTGFNTCKGNLIRSILFPKAVNFKFKNDSVKYIILMALLSFIGFGISVPFLIKANLSWIEILKKSLDLITTTVPPSLPACLGIGISYALSRLKKFGIICINRDRVNIAGKVNMICFDKTGTLTEDHLDIYGYKPVKLQKDVFVFNSFEKTATAYSQNAYDHYKKKRNMTDKDKNKDLNEFFVECLASCHCATLVNQKLIGDPIDVKMFEASGWTLIESGAENQDNTDSLISTYVRPKEEIDLNEKLAKLTEGEDEEKIFREHYELGVVRRFDFSSKLQRMSVIVKDVNEEHYKIFCKGSPEKIRELCKDDTIPEDFNMQLTKYTSKGFRVLAMGMKMVKMNYIQAQQMPREKAESKLIFLGLLIVQNRLKEMTKPSIEILDQAGIRMVMATGDNILTAISVSKECKLINQEVVVYTCEIENNELIWNTVENFQDEDDVEDLVLASTHKDIIEEDPDENNELIDGNDRKYSAVSFTQNFPPENFTMRRSRKPSAEVFKNSVTTTEQKDKENTNKAEEESLIFNIEVQNYPFQESISDENVIALTGATFEKLLRLKDKYLSATKNEKYKPYYDVFKLILRHGFIFARMSPEHKTMLVESLKKEKLTVLMCGDGANDCGALRAADIGVSLSPEEASIAAHFTSKIPDISCLIKLLREGKASLVTSIQTFKYMMIYSLIQFISVTLLMVVGSYLSDTQFLATDVFIIFPLAFFIAKTGAYNKLTHHRPTDSLLSFPIIASILIQTIISFGFQYGGWALLYYKKGWFDPETYHCVVEGNKVFACPENTVIYLISNMQYLITAFAFSISKPFRKPLYTNVFLTLFMIFAFAYSVYIIVYPDDMSINLLNLFKLRDKDPRLVYYLLGLSMINFILSYLTEKAFVPLMTKIHTARNIKKLQERAKDPSFEYTLNQLQKIKVNK